MKKALIAVLLSLAIAAPAAGSEYDDKIAELEARIAALEARLDALEGKPAELPVNAAGEPFSLGVGTFIVGEDLPEGKYNVICGEGTAVVTLFQDLATKEESDYMYKERYDLASKSYLDSLASTYAEIGMDSEIITSIWTEEVNNFRVYAGNCIVIEDNGVTFTPVS